MLNNRPVRGGQIRRIMIVDDHPLLRLGLRQLLEEEKNLQICCEADTISEALRQLKIMIPELVITDLTLAGGNGLDLIKRLRAERPDIRILVCSMHDEGLFAYRALNAGAMGYISKAEATLRIVEAVHRVLQGRIWISEIMREKLSPRFLNRSAGHDSKSGLESLSNRELEVFEMIGSGVRTSQIAQQLHLSIKTVETHRDNIKKKLHLASGNELTRRAIQWVLQQD